MRQRGLVPVQVTDTNMPGPVSSEMASPEISATGDEGEKVVGPAEPRDVTAVSVPDTASVTPPAASPDIPARAVDSTLSGVDKFLDGKGKAGVFVNSEGRPSVRFTDFSVPDLPGLQIVLVASDNVKSGDDILAADAVLVGPLESISGDQDYPLPEGIDIADYPTIAVWSRPYGLLVAQAKLTQ